MLRRLSDRTRVRVNLLGSRGLPIGLVTVVVGGYRANHWIYRVGPLTGGALAALLYSTLYLRRREPA